MREGWSKREIESSSVCIQPRHGWGCRVVAAKPSYILAMKLNALERSTSDDRDFQVQLGVACGASTIEGLRDIYRKFFADEKLSPTAELRLGELARAIQSKAQS